AAFNSGVRAAIFGSTIVVPTMIGLLGRERREFTTLADGTTEFIYPYSFGGVRITLLAGGLFAIMGAVAAGLTLHRALAREQSQRFVLPEIAAPVAPSRPGCLVVFEGGDGSGKSTQIRMLEHALVQTGHDVVVTREPGGTPVGEGIRALLLDSAPGSIGDRTEALLYAGARAQHVDRVIRPALETGAVVLCDRFVDSSVVYQGAARELGEDHVVELNRWATGGLEPDLTVLLDIDPVDGLRRATEGRDADRMESEGDGFHRTVRDAYLRRSASGPGDYLVLDATRTVDDLHRQIVDVVTEHLGPADVGA
ncbi:MAG: dTMP kinase, partial [Nitriliruptoraceae bacterium]